MWPLKFFWNVGVSICMCVWEQGRGGKKEQVCFELQRKLSTCLHCFSITFPTTSPFYRLIELHTKSFPSYRLKLSPSCPLPPLFQNSIILHWTEAIAPEKMCRVLSTLALHRRLVISPKHKSDNVIPSSEL